MTERERERAWVQNSARYPRPTSVIPARDRSVIPALHLRHTRACRGYLAASSTQALSRHPSAHARAKPPCHPRAPSPSYPRTLSSFLRPFRHSCAGRNHRAATLRPTTAALQRRPRRHVTGRRVARGRVGVMVVAWIPACAGMTERERAEFGRQERGLGAELSEIPAASAGMTRRGRGRDGEERGCGEEGREGAWVQNSARYPRRSAGMTDLSRAGMTEGSKRGCDGAHLARVRRSSSRASMTELISRGHDGGRARSALAAGGRWGRTLGRLPLFGNEPGRGKTMPAGSFT